MLNFAEKVTPAVTPTDLRDEAPLMQPIEKAGAGKTSKVTLLNSKNHYSNYSSTGTSY
ncbi:MAG: hypothetical protein U5L96_14630 [Owenweeksia sp.]|nr:hypothetical protein [Owenweeksia sp.]